MTAEAPADSNNQIAYLGMYTTDIHAVLNDITGMLANPGGVTVGGAAFNLADADTAVLTQVQGQLQTLITLANGSVGNSAAAATNQELIHTTQTSILNEVNGDTALANALAGATYAGGTGADNAGFQALPTGADDAASLAAASGANATLAQIGTVFNAATDLAVGGLNSTNLGQFNTDMKAISAGLTNLVNNPDAIAAIDQAAGITGADAALTKVHLDTVLEQINSQINNFDNEYATNPNVAARSTNDNLLDIIDIVQGDAALNAAAGGNGNAGNTGGFSEMPAYLEGTITRFQDDQAQTNFWARFLSEGNVINNQLDNVAAGNNTTQGELQALVTEIQNYQKFGAAFDHSQGGIFGARFDNELLGGTLNADTANAVHGLQGILNGDTGEALAATRRKSRPLARALSPTPTMSPATISRSAAAAMSATQPRLRARPRSPALPRARSRLRAPRRERRVLSPKAAVLAVAADKPAMAAKLLAGTAHKVLRDKAGKALAATATATADRAIPVTAAAAIPANMAITARRFRASRNLPRTSKAHSASPIVATIISR